MRRSRTGLGSWRSENPRHFRPQGGGGPYYRPLNSYGIPEGPRFPPPGPRLNRPLHFNPRLSHGYSARHERSQYRSNHHNNQHGAYNINNFKDKNGPRNIYPYNQQLRHEKKETANRNQSNLYEVIHNVQPCLIKNTVNIDQMHASKTLHIKNYDKQNINPNWSGSVIENNVYHFDKQSPSQSYRHAGSSEPSKIPHLDYHGHRPPSSDYYGGNPSPVTNNNTSFSRSVDDTVDIVRKRLLSRSESQKLTDDCISDQAYNMQTSDPSCSYQKNQSETPAKKKVLRQRHAIKSNCDKIKNKIVHQLFKMDKDKIHKLMDNPSSSTKFEYAISSLITESQISLNRHLRSVAEKSLCSSRTEFIQNDNNTIYEDTFMKQMQCILDPQDTVLLEDIKPLVMAELSKFLQIEEYDQNSEVGTTEDHVNYQPEKDFADCPSNESYNIIEQSQNKYSDDQTVEFLYNNLDPFANEETNDTYQYENDNKDRIQSLYERSSTVLHNDYSEERRQSSENRRKSLESKPPMKSYKLSPTSVPLFDPNINNLTEEEDPFAELDKQYHVPVDHNFIEPDVYASVHHSSANITVANDISFPYNINEKILPDHHINVNNNLQSDTQNMASLLQNMPIHSTEMNNETITTSQSREVLSNDNYIDKSMTSIKYDKSTHILLEKQNTKCDNTSRTKYADKKEPDKKDAFGNHMKSYVPSNSRKRSNDQKPSHRKEKRKKSESLPFKSNQDLSLKKSYNNLRHYKSSEKGKDPRKSFIYSYYSENRQNRDLKNESKKKDTTCKAYSDKYVRRKEFNKNKNTKFSKKRTSDSSCSSKLASDTNGSCLTSSKSDIKTKLKPINMFEEKSKKVHLHQAHRNTALPTSAVNSNINTTDTAKATSPSSVFTEASTKKLISQHTQTDCCKSSNVSQSCQTDKKKFLMKSVQTDSVFLERFKSNCTDTFERMKEIDLEIQVLLQEKFKLYSSMENKNSCNNAMQSLGMTVLNVTPLEDPNQDEMPNSVTEASADSIVHDYTNIPALELEQIPIESIEGDKTTTPNKRTRRAKNKVFNNKSKSIQRRVTKKASPLNISLLEQIITDDRPLEDILRLDEFENYPVKKNTPAKRNKTLRTRKKPVQHKNHIENFQLKDCSVVMERMNIIGPLIVGTSNINDRNELPIDFFSLINEDVTTTNNIFEESDNEIIEIQPDCTELVEEDNSIQFDMLDVSEDIVIGDSCETKSDDKGINERIDVPITEEIILDNSQSSCDDLMTHDTYQGENECKMYDYSNDENLQRDSITVTGNGDAVLAIECVDNNFIAASLDGNVYHFNSDGQLINTLRGSNLAVTCLTIVKEKYGTTVYTGSLDSRIRYYDLGTGVEKGPECNVLSPIQTMDRAWDTIFVGTRTGFVLQFECKNNMLIPVSTVKFSEQSILALRAMKEGPRKVLLVAARSENVTIKDAQTGLLLRTLVGPKMTVYTLLFEDGKVYCGTSSHQIHVFDYSTGSHVGSHEGGKGAVCLRATGGLVFAGCYDGCVYVYREGETRPLAQLRGPGLMLLSLAVVGSKIIAGYKDRSLYIWKIPLSILQEMIL